MHNYLRYADSDVKRHLSDLQTVSLHDAAMAKLEAHDRLRIARKRRYKTAREASDALGVPYGTYTGHESGSRGFAEEAERYAKAFRVRAAWLVFEEGPMELGKAEQIGGANLPNEVGPRTELAPSAASGGARDLPNYGTAVGGGSSDGDFRLNGEVTELVARPPALVGRKKAFCVTMQNTSMHPVYKEGRRIYVDPDGLRPSIGDDVLIEMYPEEDGEPGASYVKTLVSRGATEIVVTQYNPPPPELRFKVVHVKQILRVIPYEELLGV